MDERSDSNLHLNDQSPEGMSLRQWVHAVRIGVYLLVLVLAVVTNVSQSQFTNWNLLKSFYFFSFVGLSGHALELWKFDKVYQSKGLLFGSFVFDVVLITVLSTQTRLNDSLFLFMYMATILVGSLLGGLRMGLTFAGLCSVAYSVGTLMGPEVKSLHVFFLLIVNNFGFFSMAFLGGRFSEDLESVEQELNRSNLSLDSLRKIQSLVLESVSSGLVTTNSIGVILTFNPAAEKLFAKDMKSGESINEFFDSKTETDAAVEREIEVDGAKKLIRIQKMKAGEEINSGLITLWTLDDLTDSRRMEMSLRQSEKMAAIGHLSAGIAHEIRNPLAGISGSVELLGDSTTKDEERRLKNIILREINRLNNLITEFLDYSKPDEPVRDKVQLSQVMRECVEFLKPQSPGVEFLLQLEDVKILGNSQKLRQVFLNMILNSVQAMAKSDLKRISIHIRSAPEKRSVIVVVRDSGCGIPDSIKNRIFEPFMTTKPKGTGLGLAMSHKILESHRAQIFIESRVGEGTEFTIQFPEWT